MSFSIVLTKNYQITESISFDPEISNTPETFWPKNIGGHPRMFNIRVLPWGIWEI